MSILDDYDPPPHWSPEMVERFRPHYPDWWPAELYNCDWRQGPKTLQCPDGCQVKTRGGAESSWRTVPKDPLDETG